MSRTSNSRRRRLERISIDDYEIRSKLAEIMRELNLKAMLDRVVVVVEGPRDELALRRAGYIGPIIRLNSPGLKVSSFSSIIAYKSYSRVVLLLDYDEHGEMLVDRLRRTLEYDGVEVDLKVREEIFNACNKGIRHIEELKRFIEITT